MDFEGSVIKKRNYQMKEIENLNIPEQIKGEATALYKRLIRSTKKNSKRRAAIYLCVVHTFLENEMIYDAEKLKSDLKIKTKDINSAYSMIAPKFSLNVATYSSVFRIIANKEKLLKNDVEKMKLIYHSCKNKVQYFNSSKLNTLCWSVVYFYVSKVYQEEKVKQILKSSPISFETLKCISDDINKIVKIKL